MGLTLIAFHSSAAVIVVTVEAADENADPKFPDQVDRGE